MAATNNALNIKTAGIVTFDGSGVFTGTNYTDTTWTPTLTFNATTGITYTTQVGYYTRIGNLVYISVNIVLSSKGSSTGFAGINGLPVAASSTSVQYILNAYYLGMASLPGGTLNPSGVIQASASNLLPFAYSHGGGGAFNQLGYGNFTDTSTIRFDGFYRV